MTDANVQPQAVGPQADPRWARIPAELRQRPQWAVAGADKAPLGMVGGKLANTSVNRPGEWLTFDQACVEAAERSLGIGFVLNEADPFACIDLDVKDATNHPGKPDKWTTAEQLERHHSIIDAMGSYTERSRSGLGWHVWVRADARRGTRSRDMVELYSQQRFIICTGNVVRDVPIADRHDLVANMAARMRPAHLPDAELRPDDDGDDQGWAVANWALEDGGELGRLMSGDWEGRHYPSHSEADFALMMMLARLTDSNGACRDAFLLSGLSKRADKPNNYTRSRLDALLCKVRPVVTEQTYHIEQGLRIAGTLFWPEPTTVPALVGPNSLDRLRVDWSDDSDTEVPDIIEGLVADEDVTLLGGHGGIGKSFLAMQMACAAATGGPVLHRETRQCRVLYYSAEDGRKRLTRRLRNLVEFDGRDEAELRRNLLVLDASEVEPLYGETIEQGEGKRPVFVKLLGPRADFDNLQKMVEAFDPQLVVIDGASDTFDGNEIARREVRAFIKMLRRIHPSRKVGVLLLVHIVDRRGKGTPVAG